MRRHNSHDHSSGEYLTPGVGNRYTPRPGQNDDVIDAEFEVLGPARVVRDPGSRFGKLEESETDFHAYQAQRETRADVFEKFSGRGSISRPAIYGTAAIVVAGLLAVTSLAEYTSSRQNALSQQLTSADGVVIHTGSIPALSSSAGPANNSVSQSVQVGALKSEPQVRVEQQGERKILHVDIAPQRPVVITPRRSSISANEHAAFATRSHSSQPNIIRPGNKTRSSGSVLTITSKP